MSKFTEYIHYTDSGALITILFDRSGNIISASYADKSMPINISMTEQLQKIQSTPWAQLSWSENKMRLDIQKWHEKSLKQNSNNDFDKEPA